MWILAVILHALYYFSPAYAANSLPVLFGGGKPIDFGRYCRDGRRVLGDGKTWRGFVVGLFFGYLMGLLWYFLSMSGPLSQTYYGIDFRMPDPFFGLYMGLGALLGDMLASFLKRRLGLERGQRLWGLDQLDFLIGAAVFAYLLAPTFPIWQSLVAIAVITPLFHLIGNFIGYKAGAKSVPW